MKSKDENLDAVYIMVSSLEDLARCASGSQGHIKAISVAKRFRLLVEGERIGEQMIYFFDVDSIGRYLIYMINESAQSANISNKHLDSAANYNSYALPIVQISSDPYKKIAHPKMDGAGLIEALDLESLVRATISNAYGEAVQKMYAFDYKGKHIIGTFELFKKKRGIFAYVSSESGFGGLLEYDYSTDSIKSSQKVDLGKTYIKVVHLSEPFPFFENAKA